MIDPWSRLSNIHVLGQLPVSISDELANDKSKLTQVLMYLPETFLESACIFFLMPKANTNKYKIRKINSQDFIHLTQQTIFATC